MNHSDKARSEAAILAEKSSFKEVVDETCNRLWDKKVQYSIRHIRELEDTLKTLELELDMMIRDEYQ